MTDDQRLEAANFRLVPEGARITIDGEDLDLNYAIQGSPKPLAFIEKALRNVALAMLDSEAEETLLSERPATAEEIAEYRAQHPEWKPLTQ